MVTAGEWVKNLSFKGFRKCYEVAINKRHWAMKLSKYTCLRTLWLHLTKEIYLLFFCGLTALGYTHLDTLTR